MMTRDEIEKLIDLRIQEKLDGHLSTPHRTGSPGVTADDIANAITHGAATTAGHIRLAAQRGSGG